MENDPFIDDVPIKIVISIAMLNDQRVNISSIFYTKKSPSQVPERFVIIMFEHLDPFHFEEFIYFIILFYFFEKMYFENHSHIFKCGQRCQIVIFFVQTNTCQLAAPPQRSIVVGEANDPAKFDQIWRAACEKDASTPLVMSK